MRILLIEDDKALCQVLQPTLQAAGFASDCCHTGADGLHLLKTGYYDACILDRMLPELDGLTLLKSARADGVSIPVLMLTALGQIGDRVDGLDAGADDYLITVNCWPGCGHWSAGRRICMRPPTGLPVAILSWIPPS